MIRLDQLPGSTIQDKPIAVIRQHWISLVPLAISATLLLILVPAALWMVPSLASTFFAEDGRHVLFVMGVSIFFLFGSLFLFQTFMEYWLDVGVITDKRFIDIDQTGLFSRTISELRLNRIQDVTAETNGMFASILDYGSVSVQTAGEEKRFELHMVPHPNEIARTLMDLVEKERSVGGGAE